MTRQEQTFVRDLGFSQWIRKSLPDSATGFLVTDLDFILFNYKTKKFMLIEVKSRSTRIKIWQQSIFRLMDEWISGGMRDGWTNLGFHVIMFENTNFSDGAVYLDDLEVSENTLKNFLSV
jgi:hypothetical protein